jgi:predicted lipoprotein with Yx(FWY)xxD motif
MTIATLDSQHDAGSSVTDNNTNKWPPLDGAGPNTSNTCEQLNQQRRATDAW